MLMPYIYHPSRIIYYSSTHSVLLDHHYLLLIITLYFYFFIIFPHTSVLMADANAMYHPSLIIYYSSIHYVINPHFSPLWMVDANLIVILLFISSYFRSVWHPLGCFILRMQHGLFV